MRTPAISTTAVGAILAFALVSSVAGLPRGYREDFNGCAQNSPNEQDRDRCCQETLVDCQNQCQTDNANNTSDLSAGITCSNECLQAALKCKGGQTVRVLWPGEPGFEVPGIKDESSALETTDGARFEESRRSLLVELRNPGPAAGAVCLGLVVACEAVPVKAGAPASSSDCYPEMKPSKLECRPRGAKQDRPKLCRPVVLSIQPCAP